MCSVKDLLDGRVSEEVLKVCDEESPGCPQAGRMVLRAEQILIWLTKREERPEVPRVGEGLVQN